MSSILTICVTKSYVKHINGPNKTPLKLIHRNAGMASLNNVTIVANTNTAFHSTHGFKDSKLNHTDT